MIEKKFDVMPILSNNKFEAFYSTKRWGVFSKIEEKKIDDAVHIYYRVNIYDFLKKVDKEQFNYCFLTDGNEIVGLISINNLNYLPVYNYLYQWISRVESSIIEYIKNKIEEIELIRLFEDSSDGRKKETLSSFKEDQKNNKENNFFSYLYFTDLGYLIKRFEHQLGHNVKDLQSFSRNFNDKGLYADLRNTVAHPNKILFQNFNDVNRVFKILEEFQEILSLVES